MSSVDTLSKRKVITAGICCQVLTVGLARFAYTPLLPIMQAQADLDSALGGWLASANYAGYMAGALIASRVSDAELRLRLYRVCLVLGVIGTMGMGMTSHPWMWLSLRFVAGTSSAGGMLLASGMILRWLLAKERSPQLGLHFVGMGLGITISGLLVMTLSPVLDWAEQWQIMGGLGLILLVPAWAWIPHHVPSSAFSPEYMRHDTPRLRPVNERQNGPMTTMLLAYFCAGVGYVVSATFIVAAARNDSAFGNDATIVWVVVGVAATPACIFWDWIARKISDIRALQLAYGLQILSFCFALMGTGVLPVLIGAFLFGATFIGIVSLTLSIAGRRSSDSAPQAMARMTLSYGLAQVLIPAISGVIADHTGSYAGSLWIAIIAMTCGLVLVRRA